MSENDNEPEASEAKPVMPEGAKTVRKQYALTIPEHIRKTMLVRYLGELMFLDDYAETQKALNAELSSRSGGNVPKEYWKSFEIVKYDNGRYVARKRSERLDEVDAEDGKQSVARVANFSYARECNLDAKIPGGKYGDADRLVIGELDSEPEVGEVQDWTSM